MAFALACMEINFINS